MSVLTSLIPFLIEDGKALAILQRKAKTATKEPEKLDQIHVEVKKLIPEILKKVDSFQPPASFSEKVIPKVLDKVQAALHEFIKLGRSDDPEYKKIAESVNDCISRKQAQAVESASPANVQQHSGLSTDVSTDQGVASANEIFQDDPFANLNDIEMSCLSYFCVFPVGKEVKKREPIHLWIGMDLMEDPSVGATVLEKLVTEGFIERTIGNKKLSNRYRMNETVHKLVIDQLNLKVNANDSFSVFIGRQKQKEQPPTPQQQQQQQQASPQQPASNSSAARIPRKTFSLKGGYTISNPVDDDIALAPIVLNIKENTLQAKVFERLSKGKNNVKVIDLGNLHDDSERYVVVEEIDDLRSFMKHIKQVTVLSLEGISGIVELPDSVYNLKHLKVLDLRGCPNLESLPRGIDSLGHLTHLDLSECYLLDYIPKEITHLTKLIVLKGFVINPEEEQDSTEKEKENENENENEKEKETEKEKEKKVASNASFSDLKALTQLTKLTIRTRRKDSPKSDDLDILCKMQNLKTLRIAWVCSSDDPSAYHSGKFPAGLEKLEFQAASENTLSRLLRLISEDTTSTLKKLYIRGGQLWDLGEQMHHFPQVCTVRLRYLPELRIDWEEFRKYFPKLTRLEVSECPNLIFFPCDENGVWEETQYTHNH